MAVGHCGDSGHVDPQPGNLAKSVWRLPACNMSQAVKVPDLGSTSAGGASDARTAGLYAFTVRCLHRFAGLAWAETGQPRPVVVSA